MIKLNRDFNRFKSHAGVTFLVFQQNGIYADILDRKKSDEHIRCSYYSNSFQRAKVFKGR